VSIANVFKKRHHLCCCI